MFEIRTIHTENDEVELSCFMYKGKPEDPSIKWMEIKHPDYPDINLYWDNEDYIYRTFYPFLKRYETRTMTLDDLKDPNFKQVLQYLNENEDLISELIDVFEYSIKEGWYEFKGPETE